MAKNAGDGHRIGSERKRTQILNPQNKRWTKRDKLTGEFMDQKEDGGKFEGVRREHIED